MYVASKSDLMRYDVRGVNDTAVIALAGDIDTHSSPAIRQKLLESLEQNKHVVADLSAVHHIESSGIASLVEAVHAARKSGASFALTAVSSATMGVLTLARLEKVFRIYPSAAIAIASQIAGDGYSWTTAENPDLTAKPQQAASGEVRLSFMESHVGATSTVSS